MQPPTVREVAKRLGKEGWKLNGCKGDHWKFENGEKVVIVPGKMGDHIKQGTWKSIKNQVGW